MLLTLEVISALSCLALRGVLNWKVSNVGVTGRVRNRTRRGVIVGESKPDDKGHTGKGKTIFSSLKG